MGCSVIKNGNMLKLGDCDQYDSEFDKSGWKDLIAPFSSAKGRGTAEPVWADTGHGLYAMKFTINDELFVSFHVDHDYKIGSKAYLHVHWFPGIFGLEVGDEITFQVTYKIAKGHKQGESLIGNPITDPVIVETLTYIADGTEIGGEHIVLEMDDLQAFDLLEPDTIIKVGIKLITCDNADGYIFGEMCDIHYQADRNTTPNKKPDFYN